MSKTACKCGKPVVHLVADEDSAEWSCRVPVVAVADYQRSVRELRRELNALRDAEEARG